MPFSRLASRWRLGLILIAGLGLILGLGCRPTASSGESAPTATYARESTESPEYPNSEILVDVGWLEAHLDDAALRVIDMRDPESYGERHVPGAANIPVASVTESVEGIPFELDAEGLRSSLRRAGVTKDMTAVVYDDLGMMDSARLFWSLEYAGHEDVRVLHGGWNAWLAEGGEVDSDAPAYDASQYELSPDETKLATKDYILDRLGDAGLVILDARSPQEYSGDMKFAKRAGHIPGAVNLPWRHVLAGGDSVYTADPAWRQELMDEDVELFKPADQIRAQFDERGITPDKEVITYCQTLWRGAHAYFMLRLMGFEDVRGYDGSWAEWGNDPDLPVVLGDEPGSVEDATPGDIFE